LTGSLKYNETGDELTTTGRMKTTPCISKSASGRQPGSVKRALPVPADKISKRRRPFEGAAAEKPKGNKGASASAGSSKPKPGLAQSQVEKAVLALCTHLSRGFSGGVKQDMLLGEVSQIFIVLNTKQMPKEASGAKSMKPVRLDLPHAWRSLVETEVSLIVKAPQSAVKDRLAAQGATGVKVIGIDKLKKKYVPFEAKNKLRAANDLMLADDRVLPQLPPLLGSGFFKSNKLPLPIDVRKSDLAGEIERCVGAAILRPGRGTCCSLVVANSTQPQKEIVANIISATEQVVQRLKGRWGNVQGVHLRVANGVSLPLYTTC